MYIIIVLAALVCVAVLAVQTIRRDSHKTVCESLRLEAEPAWQWFLALISSSPSRSCR